MNIVYKEFEKTTVYSKLYMVFPIKVGYCESVSTYIVKLGSSILRLLKGKRTNY